MKNGKKALPSGKLERLSCCVYVPELYRDRSALFRASEMSGYMIFFFRGGKIGEILFMDCRMCRIADNDNTAI